MCNGEWSRHEYYYIQNIKENKLICGTKLHLDILIGNHHRTAQPIFRMSFSDLFLDPRLLRALTKEGFEIPTGVQNDVIPKALEGRDIMVHARTGSGKTLAYLVPAIHRILQSDKGRAGWQAIILVPTRELCEQVKEECARLLRHCGDGPGRLGVSALLTDGHSLTSAASKAGQVVVTTPARVAKLLRSGFLTPQLLERSLTSLVLDEADLLLSFGYGEDMGVIAPAIHHRSCQSMLMSATTSEEVNSLATLMLHSPVVLTIKGNAEQDRPTEGDGQSAEDKSRGGGILGGVAEEVEHRRIDLSKSCSSGGVVTQTTEKLLYLLTLLKLSLVEKKVLIFVNTVDQGMRVRLFLDAFGIRAPMIAGHQPMNTRHHMLQQFNKGLFDYLIASDDGMIKSSKETSSKASASTGMQESKEFEFGVTRGIDFKGVKTVLNFDTPGSLQEYVHRVGRTGRAGISGVAISLFAPLDEAFAAELELACKESEITLSNEMSPDVCTRAEALRYRAEDVSRSITKNVIREARAKDLRNELLNSKRLASFFEQRPKELDLLRHDRPLVASAAAGAAASHLKHLPSYLLNGESTSISQQKGKFKKSTGLSTQKRGLDPIKGFMPAPKKRGADRLEEPTEMEIRAEAAAKKERKTLKKLHPEFVPKQNVRKHKGRKR